MIRILIVDDHPMVREGLELIIQHQEDMTVIGHCTDGEQAVAWCDQHAPDLVLMDINLPGLNGIEACRIIRMNHPEVRVLALSMLQEASLIKLMIKHGAGGYVLKNAGKKDILQAIRTVHEGGSYFSPEMLALIAGSPGAKVADEQQLYPSLSRREKEILYLIIHELTTSEIAAKLFLSPDTVETHRRNMLAKLDVKNTAGLVRIALEYRLLDPPPNS